MLGYAVNLDTLSIKEQINFFMRFILVNSIMYYELDYNMYSDKEYDACSKRLIDLKREHANVYRENELYYAFEQFDGSTGFDLYHNLSDTHKKMFYDYARHCKYVSQKRKKVL